jgi:hypothetical protein
MKDVPTYIEELYNDIRKEGENHIERPHRAGNSHSQKLIFSSRSA